MMSIADLASHQIQFPHRSHHSSLVRVPFCRRTPNERVSLEHLKKLGVLYWKLKGEEDPKLTAIREARGYSYKVHSILLSFIRNSRLILKNPD